MKADPGTYLWPVVRHLSFHAPCCVEHADDDQLQTGALVRLWRSAVSVQGAARETGRSVLVSSLIEIYAAACANINSDDGDGGRTCSCNLQNSCSSERLRISVQKMKQLKLKAEGVSPFNGSEDNEDSLLD